MGFLRFMFCFFFSGHVHVHVRDVGGECVRFLGTLEISRLLTPCLDVFSSI